MAKRIAGCMMLAFIVAGCSGGGGGKGASTATGIAEAPPSIEAIRAYIGQGFINEKISFKSTLIDAFRDPAQVTALADACAANDAGPTKPADPNYWPTVLGKCFTAGDATMRLYQFTGRDDFLRANHELQRLHRAKLEEANAAGAGIGEDYWSRVVESVYSQVPFTPTPAATTPATSG